jgi:hypothetical protein
MGESNVTLHDFAEGRNVEGIQSLLDKWYQVNDMVY